MAYIAEPRGGATRDYYSVPKVSIVEPEDFNPTATDNNDTTVNQYKTYTDTLLYSLLFFVLLQLLNKLKDKI